MPDSRSESLRQRAIRVALTEEGRLTEVFAGIARCSLGEAVVELQRLVSAGIAQSRRGKYGMEWRLSPLGQEDSPA